MRIVHSPSNNDIDVALGGVYLDYWRRYDGLRCDVYSREHLNSYNTTGFVISMALISGTMYSLISLVGDLSYATQGKSTSSRTLRIRPAFT